MSTSKPEWPLSSGASTPASRFLSTPKFRGISQWVSTRSVPGYLSVPIDSYQKTVLAVKEHNAISSHWEEDSYYDFYQGQKLPEWNADDFLESPPAAHWTSMAPDVTDECHQSIGNESINIVQRRPELDIQSHRPIDEDETHPIVPILGGQFDHLNWTDALFAYNPHLLANEFSFHQAPAIAQTGQHVHYRTLSNTSQSDVEPGLPLIRVDQTELPDNHPHAGIPLYGGISYPPQFQRTYREPYWKTHGLEHLRSQDSNFDAALDSTLCDSAIANDQTIQPDFNFPPSQSGGVLQECMHKANWSNITPQRGRPISITAPHILLSPIEASQDRSRSQTDLAEDDEFLLASRRVGKSYKQIKTEGNFKEAESTLRGRYRALTKRPAARVRKPQWTTRDVELLHQLVAQYLQDSDSTSSQRPQYSKPSKSNANNHAISKIPWKQIADCMHLKYDCYRFGNATVKKKYMETRS